MADRLRLSATRLARRLRQESGTDLTPSQLSALAAIDRHGPLTLGALAEVERVAPPSVTKAVTKLEAEGLVARRTDGADRRVAWVSLTPAGATRLARIRKRRSVWLGDAPRRARRHGPAPARRTRSTCSTSWRRTPDDVACAPRPARRSSRCAAATSGCSSAGS